MPKDMALLDATSLIGMGNTSSVLGHPNLMNALNNPYYGVAVTSTVLTEATRNKLKADASVIDSWALSSIASGRLTVINTNSFASLPGKKGVGDASILNFLEIYSGLMKVDVITDDRRLSNKISALDKNNIRAIGLGNYLTDSLLNGGVSYNDYQNILIDKGLSPIGVGGAALITNGATLELVPSGVLITDSLGVEHLIGYNDKFSVSRAGLVTDLGGLCFASGAEVDMFDGGKQLIQNVRIGDIIASFDGSADGGRGILIGRRVVRTFVNENQIVIDFHGTSVTPGHAYLCGDGPHQGRFRQIMNTSCATTARWCWRTAR